MFAAGGGLCMQTRQGLQAPVQLLQHNPLRMPPLPPTPPPRSTTAPTRCWAACSVRPLPWTSASWSRSSPASQRASRTCTGRARRSLTGAVRKDRLPSLLAAGSLQSNGSCHKQVPQAIARLKPPPTFHNPPQGPESRECADGGGRHLGPLRLWQRHQSRQGVCGARGDRGRGGQHTQAHDTGLPRTRGVWGGGGRGGCLAPRLGLQRAPARAAHTWMN